MSSKRAVMSRSFTSPLVRLVERNFRLRERNFWLHVVGSFSKTEKSQEKLGTCWEKKLAASKLAQGKSVREWGSGHEAHVGSLSKTEKSQEKLGICQEKIW